MTTPERSTAKSQRVLACVLCQQRKVKCDRNFPCQNCNKAQVQCVPAATLAPRQRRRRFAERELLDRLRRYENLLNQHKIKHEPLHEDFELKERSAQKTSKDGDESLEGETLSGTPGQEGPLSPSVSTRSETVYKARNIWHVMNQRQSQDSDEDSSDSSPDDIVRQGLIRQVWDQLDTNDLLLFGSRESNIDLSTLHPNQGHIFRLWQTYLDNVNPLLKVTHTPTLQGRIIDAASNLANAKPPLQALMFSIYCMSIVSLPEEECDSMFGSPKSELLTKYQFGCQQALVKSGFLRSSDRECLTALYLYLNSVRPNTDPQSLSPIVSIAIRLAQRMGLHNETTHNKFSVLEAEMRRRLWWSLVLFDARICEMASDRTTTLVPTWNCRTPLNVNDFDLRAETKQAPTVQGSSSEALFAVVRSEIGDFIRHTTVHLDYTIPALKPIAQSILEEPHPEGGQLPALVETLEDKYFKNCDQDNPLHFMTVWTARGYLAKTCLFETCAINLKQSQQMTDSQLNSTVSYALYTVECDTKIMNSPLTKGFQWFTDMYFPFPAYIHVISDLKKRPMANHAEHAWEVMSDNYEARRMPEGHRHYYFFFELFANAVYQAWEAREALLNQARQPIILPRIIADIKQKRANNPQPSREETKATTDKQSSDLPEVNIDAFSLPTAGDLSNNNMFYGMGGQTYPGMGTGLGPSTFDMDLSQLDWDAMDWNSMYGGGW